MLCNGSDDLFCAQSFTMELPPGAGAGRRHGGAALICKRQGDLTFRELDCDDARLCGVAICEAHVPVLTIFGCYMPFWDGSAQTADNYADIVGKLDALVAAHQSVPVALVGDFNCALSRIPAVRRPVNWTHLKGVSPLSGQMQGLIDDRDLTVAEFCYPQKYHTLMRGESIAPILIIRGVSRKFQDWCHRKYI